MRGTGVLRSLLFHFRQRINPQLNLLITYGANWVRRNGRQRNARLRQEWPYLMKRANAMRHKQDIMFSFGPGLTFIGPPHGDAVIKEVYLNGIWELPESAFIENYVQPGMTVFDIGAHVGVHTLRLAKRTEAKGHVHAFEPSAAHLYLTRNVIANGFEARVTINCAAVGDQNGKLQLKRTKPGAEAFTTIGIPTYRDANTGETFEVPLITLDDYAAAHGIEHIHLVKIDVEGSEIMALRGAQQLLEEQRVDVWLYELNWPILESIGSSADELERLFTEAGYHLMMLSDDGNPITYDLAQRRKNRDNLAVTPDVLKAMQKSLERPN